MLFFSGSKHRKFLSTPSARRATRQLVDDMLLAVISIHALREEGDVQAGTVLGASGPISIHALREEGDNRGAVHDVDFQKFLSTPSARRATKVSTTR